jgi:pyruvate formate lyase activating enzyme
MEARYYIRLEDHKVKCLLCPHQCTINDGHKGICKVRSNENATLYTSNYNNYSAINFDPIEKKPLYHFYPGSEILSLGTLGCNFHCTCCQNYEISQSDPENFPRTISLTVSELLKMAESHPGNIGVAFTYNEPSVWFEQIIDISRETSSIGLKNVIVSNGYICSDPLKELLEYTDAFNIDIKSFNEKTHKAFTGGDLKPILENLILILSYNKHLEITYLIVPGVNDSLSEFKILVNWISDNLGKNVPLHISRYFPRYKMTSYATSPEVLTQFAGIASKKLSFVYVGNISENEYQDTRCPKCSKIIIARNGYALSQKKYGKGGECLFCGFKILIS